VIAGQARDAAADVDRMRNAFDIAEQRANA